MKPKLDLESPLVQLAIQYAQAKAHIALNATQTVERAVIPICIVPKAKAHNKPKTKPEQIGSGVLVSIKEQYFIFSATHVFLEAGQYALHIAAGVGDPVQQIQGERLSTGKKEAQKDCHFDASAFHIQSPLSESLKDVAITLAEFDLEGFDSSLPIHMISGFRVKNSNTAGNSIRSKQEAFPTVEYTLEDYSKLGVDPKSQIILAYEDQVLVNGNWQVSPKPKGMSGGAIIKVQGTNTVLGTTNKNDSVKQLLTAITLEQHRGKDKRPGYLVGTRTNVYLGLIYKFMPELVEEFINEN